MKRLISIFALAASAAAWSQTPQYQPSLGAQVAGTGSNSTIQAAVTAAGTQKGSVTAPAKFGAGEMAYPGAAVAESPIATSTYDNFNLLPVQDLRPLNHDVSLLQALSLPTLVGEETAGDTAGIEHCIVAGSCVVAFVGHSIIENVNDIAADDSFVTSVAHSLVKKYPSVTWSFYDLSISGATVENFNDAGFKCESSGSNRFFRSAAGQWYTNETGADYGFITSPAYYQWPSGCINGDTWRQQVAAVSPNLVVMGFTENEYGVGSESYAADLQSAITYVHGLSSPQPTIVLLTDELPDYGNACSSGTDPNIFEGLEEVVRSMARQDGLLLGDADRFSSVMGMGVDPARRHFTVERAFGSFTSNVSFPTGWAPAPSVTGTMPTVTSGATDGALLTFAAGNAVVVQRNRNAVDVTMMAAFTVPSVGATAKMWYRNDNTVGSGYKLQATETSSMNWTVTLYWATSNTIGGTSLAANTCTTSIAHQINLLVQTTGAKHDVWCQTPGATSYSHILSLYDYNRTSAGQIALGFDVTGGSITNEYAEYGNPAAYFTPLVSTPSLFGVAADYPTNPFSYGGDTCHHPPPVGMDAYFLTAFRPVIDIIDRDARIALALAGVNGGALSAGNVTFQTGAGTSPTGLTISGIDEAFVISFTTGSSPASSSGIFFVTFTASRGHTAYCSVAPANAATAALTTARPWVFSFAATSISLASNTTALTASTAYSWAITCP